MRKFFTWKRVLLAVVLLVALFISGFVVWANNPLTPMDEALPALQSDATVDITSMNGWTVFSPTTEPPTTGFIFYPGGRVDARAYAPQLHAIAEQGYEVILVPMPLNLAIFGVNSANDVIKAFPEIQHWAVGGHSLGGSMAARFVQSNPIAVQGLVFWASYPDIDLSTFAIEAVSIYGTNDGLAKPEVVKNSAKFLPADAVFVPITGGDHSGFGWYGLQPGDKPADVSHDDQQAQTVAATVDLLARLSDLSPQGR